MNNLGAFTEVIRISALEELANVRHGFFTRHGGSSNGLYASNNCAYGSDDAPETVTRNRATCAARLGLGSIVTNHQRHTADVVVVHKPWTPEQAPVADAMVTQTPGIALGILTADCGPILLADSQAGVIGAAHAGWRGAFDGVIQNTVAAMTRLGAEPRRMIAVLGPCIGQASYEVGPEFSVRFTERDPASARYFTPPKANGRVHFDLQAFASDQLRTAGVGTVVVEGSDTCAQEKMFFSYRRSVLKNEPDYGRQLSLIGLAES